MSEINDSDRKLEIESLGTDEKEAFNNIKRSFYPISDESAYSLTMAAISMAKVGIGKDETE